MLFNARTLFYDLRVTLTGHERNHDGLSLNLAHNDTLNFS